MSNGTCIATGLAIAAGIAMTVGVERRSASQQRAQTEALAEQAAQIAQAGEENERLSNLVARAGTSSQTLSPEQLSELLRLRNEVGQLRKLEGQKALLETNIARLRESERKSQETLAQARALPNYWPKDQLAFAGYAEPESTVKSLLAAMKNGDLNAFKACFDPAIMAQFEAELKEAGADPAAKEAEFKSLIGEFLAPANGFHIVDQRTTASNEVTIQLSVDGRGQEQRMKLRKTVGGWKFVSVF